MQRYFNDYQDRYEIVFIPLSWMTSPFIDTVGHQNLTYIVLKDEYKALLPSLPSVEQMRAGVNICFIGLGILGDGVIRAHGFMSPGEVTAEGVNRGSNPTLPIIGSEYEIEAVRNGELGVEEISGFEQIRRTYVHNLNVRRNIYTSILGSGIYTSIRWIASPNMVERTARFRFGNEYVDSRAHCLHTRIAESYMDQVIACKQKGGWLITHPSDHEAASGFTKDAYAFSEAVNDIHTNAEFYRDAVKNYFESIE